MYKFILIDQNVPAHNALITFLQSHGAKLVELAAPLDILAKIDVFNLSPTLNLLVIMPLSDQVCPLPVIDNPRRPRADQIPEDGRRPAISVVSRCAADFTRGHLPGASRR